jgi:DNA helicase-2/ATP-dependent DNA helicase PcrA
MKTDQEKLNPQQLEAVKTTKGPLLIIAGAGTGKTKVIVEKIKYLLQEKLAKPEEILALTFTEKAAFEMQERVDQAVPYGYFQMWIMTFHGFADQLLHDYGFHLGINRRFQLLTQTEAIMFFKKNLFLFDLEYFRPLGNPGKFLVDLLDHFDRLKDENISPQEYLNWVKTASLTKEERLKYQELAQVYSQYQNLKHQNGYLDFSDLVFYLVRMLKKRKTVLRTIQKKFRYILVDEFQDTNIGQYDLIKLICPPKTNPNLTVVGDDSQAIYKFRGASISNILNFLKDYPRAKQITLIQNYRSRQEILDIAYKLIQNNNPNTLEFKLGISKKLFTNNPSQQRSVEFHLLEDKNKEADFIANKIKQLTKTYLYQDIAILTRTNNQLEPLSISLSRAGIPFQLSGPGILLKQKEIKDLIAYLKVLYNFDDSISLYRLLTLNIFQIDHFDLISLLNFAKKINHSLFQGLKIYLACFFKEIDYPNKEIYKPYLPLMQKDTPKKLLTFYQLINKALTLLNRQTAGQLLYTFLEESGLLSRLLNPKNEREEKIALNIAKFFSLLKEYENHHEDASVFAIVDYLEMSLELGESPMAAKLDATRYNAVNLLTIHSAKGLEFPVVFITNLVNGHFPTTEKKEIIPLPETLIKEILPEGDYHLQEERRLFYVGITRAKNQLFLTAAKLYGEGKRPQKISQFVHEIIPEEEIIKQTNRLKIEKEQLNIFNFKKPSEISPRSSIMPTTFSFTQLETYLVCPLQYKYQYIIKIPPPPAAALSFGNTIHTALLRFYRNFQINRQIGEEELMQFFKEEWIPLGYLSLKHQQKMKKTGQEILRNYLNTHHSKQLKIIDLEKPFKIKLSTQIFLTGKIDRVNELDKGKIEIVDYKTGRKPADKEIAKSLQLSLYALAAHDPSLYGKNWEEIVLSFYYLTNNEKISFQKTASEINRVVEKITQLVEQIKNSNFNYKKGFHCQYCSFKTICPAWEQ